MRFFSHALNSCVICIVALDNNASRCIEEGNEFRTTSVETALVSGMPLVESALKLT